MVLSIAVPFEVIYCIINNLRGDTSTLQTTSLVAHSFLHPSQAILFYRINLSFSSQLWEGGRSDLRKARRLVSILAKSKGLASHVRELYLEIHGFQETTQGILPQILVVLEDLRRVSLNLVTHWDKQDWAVRQAVNSLCRLESLDDITLNGLRGYPADILLPRLSQLRKLRLDFVEFLSTGVDKTHSDGKSLDVAMGSQKGQLDVLEFDDRTAENGIIQTVITALEDPKSELGINRLRVLKANGGSQAVAEAIQDTLRIVGNTLECFIWIALADVGSVLYHDEGVNYHSLFSEAGPVDLTSLKNLRRLVFSFVLNPATDARPANIDWILRSLQGMQMKHILEEIVLVLHPNQASDAVEVKEWALKLDLLLDQHEFKHLNKVSIHLVDPFSVGKEPYTFSSGIESELESYMPRLRFLGVLTVGRVGVSDHTSDGGSRGNMAVIFEEAISKTHRV